MYTKPCARAECPNLCRVGSRRRLDEAKYCSKACAYLGRAESGWKPVAHFTQAQRQAAGRKGGTAASVAKRRRACERAVGPLDQVLRRTLLHVRADLTARDLAPLTALLAQAYHVGYERGYQTGWTRTNRSREAA
jgi:hypothetical protein